MITNRITSQQYSTLLQPDYVGTSSDIIEIGQMNDRIVKETIDRLNQPIPKLTERLQSIKDSLEANDLLFEDQYVFKGCIDIHQANQKIKQRGELCLECGKQLKKIMQCQICGEVYCKDCCWRKRSMQNQKQLKVCCEICHKKFIKLLNNKDFLKEKEILIKLNEKIKAKANKTQQKIDERNKFFQEYRQQKRNNKIKESQIQKMIQEQQKKIKEIDQDFKNTIVEKSIKIKQQQEKLRIEAERIKKQEQEKLYQEHIRKIKQEENNKLKEQQLRKKRQEQQQRNKFQIRQREKKQKQKQKQKNNKQKQRQKQIEKELSKKMEEEKIKQRKKIEQFQRIKREEQAERIRIQTQKRKNQQEMRKNLQDIKQQNVLSKSSPNQPTIRKSDKFRSADNKKQTQQTTEENFSNKQKGQLQHYKDETLPEVRSSRISQSSNQKVNQSSFIIKNQEIDISQMTQKSILDMKLPKQSHKSKQFNKKENLTNSAISYKSTDEKKKLQGNQQQNQQKEKEKEIEKEKEKEKERNSLINESIISVSTLRKSVQDEQKQQTETDPQKCACIIM